MPKAANKANPLPVVAGAELRPGESIVVLPCTSVYANNDWNARTALTADTTDLKGEAGNRGFPGLVASIASDGQKTAVIVRKNPKYVKNSTKEAEREYELASGFQRYTAITTIANGNWDSRLQEVEYGGMTSAQVMARHSKSPTVNAIVRNLDDGAMREENITENTLRNALSTPDLCMAVCDLQARNSKMTQAQLAKTVNNSQPYVGKLLKIGEIARKQKITVNGKEQSMLAHWREAPFKASIAAMIDIVAEPDAKKREEAYLVAAKAGRLASAEVPEEGAGNGGKRAWFGNSKEAMAKIGTLLGYLAHEDLIDVNNSDDIFDANNVHMLLAPLRELSAKATEPEIAEICDFGAAAFIKAANEGPPAPAVVEVIPAKGEKGKANGTAEVS